MTEPNTTKTPGQVAYEAEAAFWAGGFLGEIRVYLPWGKLPPGDRHAYEAAARAAQAAGPASSLGAIFPGTLRQQVQQARDIHYEYACWHAELPGHEVEEAREAGRVSAYDEVLAMLAEAGTGSEGSEGHGQELFADAVDAHSARINAEEPEIGLLPADRWWRDA